MLRLTGILYTHATDQVEKEEIYQVYNFNFCNMDLSANANIWTYKIYVSHKEVRSRTKSAYQIILKY